jgi:tRNA-splicing ligase RtcB
MKSKDIVLKAGSMKGALEEAPEAYKDINEVARVSDALGIGSLVARMKPLAVIKG